MIALGAVCLFMASWLLIFGVLVEGRDPALSANARREETTISQTTNSSGVVSARSDSVTKKAEKAAGTKSASKSSSANTDPTSVSESTSAEPTSADSTGTGSASGESSTTSMTTSQS
jgi:hypothetical protein